MTEELKPKSRAEAVALFRAQTLGSVLCRDLARGELRGELEALSQLRVRPPDSPRTRSYAVPTLKRWYYAYKRQGLAGLEPSRRKDRGHGRKLTDAQRQLLCAIRRRYPRASAQLILRTLIAEGKIKAGTATPATLNRLFRDKGLDRRTLRVPRVRRRWQAERPDALWHADVCHASPLIINDKEVPLRAEPVALVRLCARGGLVAHAL